MLDDLLLTREQTKHGICIKCKRKEATQEDQMCDNCRFITTMDDMIQDAK